MPTSSRQMARILAHGIFVRRNAMSKSKIPELVAGLHGMGLARDVIYQKSDMFELDATRRIAGV